MTLGEDETAVNAQTSLSAPASLQLGCAARGCDYKLISGCGLSHYLIIDAAPPFNSTGGLQAVLSQQAREAVPAAMLIVKVIAETTAAQCTRRSSSGEALDVRWAKAQATLAPPGSPAGVAEHLADRLGVCTPTCVPVSQLQ